METPIAMIAIIHALSARLPMIKAALMNHICEADWGLRLAYHDSLK
jgi:hypothetical protein